MDVLTWDERSALADRGLLPAPIGEELNRGVSGESLVDRYRGAMLGLAIGDALGKPLIGQSPDDIAERVGLVNRYLTTPFPQHLLPHGQIGAPTQTALALAGSIISAGRFDPRDYSQRLMAWHPVARNAGATLITATRALRNGTSWLQSGQPSAGIGAATRAVPIGLFHPAHLDGLRNDAALQALITHSDQTAISGAVIVATAVAHLTGSTEFDPATFLAVIEGGLQLIPQEELGLRHLRSQSTLLGRIRVALDLAGCEPRRAYASFRAGGFTLESLPLAIWAFASSPDNPVGALILAVNAGGRADAVGAIAGALSGAFNGASRIPSAWLDHLEYADGIAGHADGLLEVSGAGFAATPLRDPDTLHPATYSPFQLGGSTMPTLEHAVRSASAADPATGVKIRLLPTPADVRRYAATIELRSDWDSTANGTVAAILRRRFAGHDRASRQLLGRDDDGLEQLGNLYGPDPFDFAALLAARRDDLVAAVV